MGRHPALIARYGDAQAVQEAIDAWFASFQGKEESPTEPNVPTYSGLSLLLGFSDGAPSLWAYASAPEDSERGQFREPIKKALARIDATVEGRLASGKPVGSIFTLKNRGWTDQTQVTHELAGDGWGELLAGLSAFTVENGGDSE